jgi:hypothetical protein
VRILGLSLLYLLSVGDRRGGKSRGGWFDVALPVLAGEHRAAMLTPVGCRRGRGEPG